MISNHQAAASPFVRKKGSHHGDKVTEEIEQPYLLSPATTNKPELLACPWNDHVERGFADEEEYLRANLSFFDIPKGGIIVIPRRHLATNNNKPPQQHRPDYRSDSQQQPEPPRESDSPTHSQGSDISSVHEPKKDDPSLKQAFQLDHRLDDDRQQEQQTQQQLDDSSCTSPTLYCSTPPLVSSPGNNHKNISEITPDSSPHKAAGKTPPSPSTPAPPQHTNLSLFLQLLEHSSHCTGCCCGVGAGYDAFFSSNAQSSSGCCNSLNCAMMKQYLYHQQAELCGEPDVCEICPRVWTLLRLHAQQCSLGTNSHDSNSCCPVPQCATICNERRRLHQQQRAMDDRRRVAMNQRMRLLACKEEEQA